MPLPPKTLIESFGTFCFAICLLIPNVIWRAFVFTKLWAWFAVPSLHVPALSLGYAIGLAAIQSYLWFRYDPKDDSETDIGAVVKSSFVYGFIGAWSLLTGYILHLCIS